MRIESLSEVCAEQGRNMQDNSKKIMITYIKESFEELKNNVTWLEKGKASNLMVIVAVFSILFALATWGVDSLFSKLIRLYFEKLIG
ncbi:preprotein translocase subunit SecE [Flagellimonas taeanensis]|uniref:Preprotein translocase subunit SecE n=2 Tax=Flagellimonas TaxID=444459 RepID=A0A1M6W175_9FLAO|nr:preprotein translocase subunit SecE [Allomuricauda taeanensis]SHK87447.1 preprotein translocase subunit SecE [Allomuricauda taeanensis]